MKVIRQTIVLSVKEILDLTEIYEEDERSYYGYNYRRKVKDKWVVIRRWDNSHGFPHIDVYNEDGDQIDKIKDEERTLDEVKEFIKMYHRKGVWVDHRD